ncbi:MAG: hypothetical protein Q9225_004076 [Loekoesia sp. 1 TL-2023]
MNGGQRPESLAEIDGGPLTTKPSVFAHIEEGLQKNPHEAAVICMHQPADHLSDLVPFDHKFQQRGCLTLTYTQLHRTSLALAAGLTAHGARPNETMLMLVPNGGEYAILLWTCIILRLTFTALDPSILGTPEELQNYMDVLKPAIVVVPDAVGARAMDDTVENQGLKPPLRISLGSDSSNGWKSLLDLMTEGVNLPVDKTKFLEAARRDDPERIHSILFTSGTSGRPKGCPLRVGSMSHILHSQTWLIDKENCSFALQQAHNSRAIAPAQTLQTWKEGGAVVMTGRGLVVEDITAAILQFGVTFIVLTPAMVHAIGQELTSRPFDVGSVRTIQVGGDAVTKDVLTKCAALFPRAKVCINHGMTEGGGSFRWPFFNTEIAQIPYFGEISPVGAVAPGSVVRIWDADRKSVSNTGVPGELHICSASIILHYLGRASESSFYEDEKGRWFNTGDISMINKEDLVFILGRKKDMIKRNSVAIMPAAIESCLEKFIGAQVSILCGSCEPTNTSFFPGANIVRLTDIVPL